jgi:hypothetical protein
MTLGERAKQRMIQAAERELKAIAHEVLEQAKRDISVSPPPGEDPDPAISLRESGRIGEVRRSGDRLSITVGFFADYAAAQHEGAWSYIRDGKRVVAVIHHHPGGGHTKYLERQLKAMLPEFRERLRAAVEEARV